MKRSHGAKNNTSHGSFEIGFGFQITQISDHRLTGQTSDLNNLHKQMLTMSFGLFPPPPKSSRQKGKFITKFLKFKAKMTLTRKFILCLLYARNVTPRITPFHDDFNVYAKEIVLEHYGLHLDDLSMSDKKKFGKDISTFASKARKYMGARSMKTFITFKGKGNHQVHLSLIVLMAVYSLLEDFLGMVNLDFSVASSDKVKASATSTTTSSDRR